jgi:hypothetical protein
MKRCYILGAGFSKELGLPLARELTQAVFCHASDFWLPGVRQNYLDFLIQLYPQYDFDKNWPDFEDLITILEEWDSYRIACNGKDPLPAHLKNVLLKNLGILLCERTTRSHSKCKFKPVEDFLQKVKEEQSSIIIFNWDLLIEIAAQDLGFRVSYSTDTTSSEIRIAKPHGSLNLAEVKEKQYERMKSSINVHSLDIEWKQGEILVVRACDPLDVEHRIIHPFENALFVAPTARKSYSSKWIQLQWHRALDIVRKAQEIIVIGYSLPNNDIRPRILMRLAEFSRHEEIRFKLVDPKAKELKLRYQECIRASIDPVSSPWIEWLVKENN